MFRNILFKNLPLILLSAAIIFSPSIIVGKIEPGRAIEIRAEDVLLVILGLVWIANFLISGKKKVEKPPLFFPILIWLAVIFFSLLTNWLFMNIGLSRGFFYFLKEVEFFFLYFYLFYHIKTFQTAKLLVNLWLFFGLINVGWIIYQIFAGGGYYGPSIFTEEENPFVGGGIFLLLFIFFLNILIYYYFKKNISIFRKSILTVIALAPGLGVLTSGSRSAGSAFILSMVFVFFLFLLKEKFFKKRRNIKLTFVIIFIFVGIVVLIFFLSPKIQGITRALGGFRTWQLEFTLVDPGSRFYIWKEQVRELCQRPLFLFFGLGKSFYSESHNQFVHNFIETGIVGSFSFLFLIYLIIRSSFRRFLFSSNHFVAALAGGLLVSTFAMLVLSLPGDAFLSVKLAELYWYFLGLTMAVFYLDRLSYEKSY